jgi:subtilase family serine protease
VSRATLRLFLIAVGVLAGGGVAQASVVRTGADSGRRALVQQAAAVPAGSSVIGSVSASARVQVTLALTPSDPQALDSYATQVSDPSSPLYRHYLSVDQFAARFGAGSSEEASVRSALTQAGLTVGAVSSNGLSVRASGTAADIEGTFDTQLEWVTLSDGSTAYSDVTDPTLPSAAAGAVQSVTGLDTLPAAAPQGLLRARHTQSQVRRTGRTVTDAAGPSSCIASEGPDGYTAAEIGSAYGLDGQWDAGDLGSGTTVALVELEPYQAADVTAYQTCDATNATVTNTKIDGGSANCSQQGSNYDRYCGLEDVLDIEDIAGLAPDAAIDVYEGPNTNAGLLDVYQSIVNHDAPVVSTSWGLCEAETGTSILAAENTLFEEAAVQGESVFAASGDNGANDCTTGVRAVDDPASQPDVTGVGGTTMTSDTPGATETVWNDTGAGGGAGGGGVSRDWAVPSYQSADAVSQSAINCETTPGASTTSTDCREVPDVSADADPDTGYDIRWDGSWLVVGGTSAAAPTWASLVTLADSSSACTSTGTKVGFANSLLYGLSAADFDDVISGNNTNGGATGYPAGTGYDMASGLGTPDGATLIPALCGSTASVTATTPTTTAPTTTTTVVQTVPGPAPVTTTTPTTVTTTTSGSGSSADVVRFVAHRARRSVRLGRRLRIVLRARDGAGLRLRYSARRLPRGLRIDRLTGVITGRPTRLGRSVSSITARDSRGDAETIVLRWVITRP